MLDIIKLSLTIAPVTTRISKIKEQKWKLMMFWNNAKIFWLRKRSTNLKLWPLEHKQICSEKHYSIPWSLCISPKLLMLLGICHHLEYFDFSYFLNLLRICLLSNKLIVLWKFPIYVFVISHDNNFEWQEYFKSFRNTWFAITIGYKKWLFKRENKIQIIWNHSNFQTVHHSFNLL